MKGTAGRLVLHLLVLLSLLSLQLITVMGDDAVQVIVNFHGNDSHAPPMLCMAPMDKQRQQKQLGPSQVAGASGGGSSSAPGGGKGTLKPSGAGDALKAKDGASATGEGTKGNDSFSCKVNGQNVDWFVAIKAPNGVAYRYAYTRTQANWQTAKKISEEGPVFETLSQVFESKGNVMAYNSIFPNGSKPAGSKGHMKGVFMFPNGDLNSKGFWMLHSVPWFPDLTQTSYSYPEKGRRFGQSFICITMNKSTLQKIAQSINAAKPPYYHGTPDNVTLTPDKVRFYSSSSAVFTLFVRPKNNSAQIYDIYEKIAQNMTISLRVQSWLRVGNDQLLEDTNSVSNLNGSFSWPTTKDHSKWAISSNKSRPLVCFGDLNRRESHTRQGGSAVCFENDVVWKLFNESIGELDITEGMGQVTI